MSGQEAHFAEGEPYEGHAMAQIENGSKWPFKFGVGKARQILALAENPAELAKLREWVEDHASNGD